MIFIPYIGTNKTLVKDDKDIPYVPDIDDSLPARKNLGRIYTVYFFTNAPTTVNDFSTYKPIYYVGRVKTQNYQKRMTYHKNTKHLYPAYRFSELTYEEARELEEFGMIACSTIQKLKTNPGNRIHGISESNSKGFLYSYDAYNWLLNHIEDALLNLFDGG